MAQPVFMWPFLELPILMLVHFGADLFGANFSKIFFFLLFISIFLIYKKFSVFLFLFYFFKSSLKIFCFLINFFPFYIKNASSNTPLLFFYLVFPVTDKINS